MNLTTIKIYKKAEEKFIIINKNQIVTLIVEDNRYYITMSTKITEEITEQSYLKINFNDNGMIHLIYSRNDIVYDYVSCSSVKFLKKWIHVLGDIKIIRIYES